MKEAREFQKGEEVVKRLKKKGIIVKASSMDNVAEEAPEAYKDIEEVIRVSEKLKLAKKVIEMKPLVVIMG